VIVVTRHVICITKNNSVASPNFKAIMRFYDIDGIEMDVQDPKFFIDEDNYKELKSNLEEILDEHYGLNEKQML